MTDISSFTHKFRANIGDQNTTAGSKISKRNRQPLSCNHCRLKKLKCDRNKPCETCIKRGEEASCSYGKTTPKVPDSAFINGNSRGRAQERLRHLEQLVMQMVDKPSSMLTSPSTKSESDGATSDHPGLQTPAPAIDGHLEVGSSESSYVGSTHWSAILDNIQELKSALDGEHHDAGSLTSSAGLDEAGDQECHEPDSLFGAQSNDRLTLAHILKQTLPERSQVDRRLSMYFNARYLVIPFVHTQQFQQQYEQFWQEPLQTPPLWVSMLFSICCMAATLSQAVGSEPSTPEGQPSPRISFLNAACQCIRLAGFVRPQRYVVEALGMYAQCKYMATLDPSRDVGITFSVLVRLAYRSGYHRDASKFPHFSVFEGEMRRRVWAMCRQFDLMVSFQLGLPTLIPPDSWDTQDPRNLLDADFDPATKTLPPSRPEREPTQILYFVVKSRLMTSFGKVCARALSFRQDDYSQADVMAMDQEVRATYTTVPEVLHVKTMSQSYADPSYLTMARTNCHFLYQKTIIVLHRKYMHQGNYPESTEACTEAAMAILRHMLDMHREFQPGGQLHQDRWMLSSFTMNDFYLAAMILCLSVSIWKTSHPMKDLANDVGMAEQYSMLRKSLDLCQELSSTSSEARRVAAILKVMSTAKGQGYTSTCSTVTGSAEDSTSPFTRTGRFMNSAMFPMQYDFNLSPLTLHDGQESVQTMSKSSSTVTTSNQSTPDQVLPGINGNNLGQASSANHFHHLLPGINNPSPPNYNNNMFFMPFSPAYGSANAAMGNEGSTSAANGSIDMSANMDIDWPFFDQWTALPQDETMAFENGPQQGVADAMHGLAGMPDVEWTSEPFAYHGPAGGKR